MKTISDLDIGYELIKLGFRSNMYADDEERAKEVYEYMTKNNMVFLKNTYGTIANKDFDKFFKLSNAKIYDKLWENSSKYYIDHSNILYSKKYKLHIMTSSPYHSFFDINLNVPDCHVFMINPLFLDYYVFIGWTRMNGCCNLAYVKDKYLDDFNNLKEEMKEYYGFNVFVKLGE